MSRKLAETISTVMSGLMRPWGRSGLFRRRALWAYLFVSPAVIALLLFTIGPILFTFWVSVHHWNLIEPIPQMPFAGLDNYRYLLTKDSVFQRALRNTFVFTVCGVGINTVLGLLGALLLNTRIKVRVFWRTLFFLPIVTAPLALGMMWATLLNKNYGLINNILTKLSLPPQPFLSSPRQALACIIGIAVYQYVGYYIIIYLAGLQGIPQEYYDAAAVDGANAWQSFWHITLPLLRPVLLFIVVTNTIGALQVFDVVFAATTGLAGETSGGGPAGSTMVVMLHMYNTAFKFFRMGRATAMGVILFVIIFVITLIQLRLLQERR
ncbi:MAG: sugar ABC transporter permease [Anaerolineae bacterium]|jgi:ABC-type sugar transport system permease subunit|nr:sugar ABC transporter permease [Anaerolineae bacterium]MDH7475731.1 sugar ABC transporter permease [Anaerolineae bacterium]